MNTLTLPWTSLSHVLAGRLLGGLATTVILAVLDMSAATPLQIAQQAYLKASNTGEYDVFGWAVAVSGDTVVVGASAEGSNFRGVQNTDSISAEQMDNSARGSGAVYVFVRSGGSLIQQAYLKASNADAYDYFGWSVAVSSNTIVVGAPDESSNFNGVQNTGSITPQQTNNSAPLSGAAYVFVRNGTTWSQQAYLKASNPGSNDYFGLSVSVSGDTVVVGAPYEASNATGVNGNQNNNGAFAAGAAYVFVRSGANWSQQAYLKASNAGAGDGFGTSVAISGDTVVAGALGESSNAIGVNGNQSNNSALNSGAAYVFVRSGANWSQQAYLKASNTRADDAFGASVAVSGDTVVVGAPFEDSVALYSGAAYVFVRSGTTWSPPVYLKASNPGLSDWFGRSVAVSGDTVVVGAPLEDSNATEVNGNQSDNSASRAGAAYVFVRSGTSWTQEAYLKASNTRADDVLGLSVAVSGDMVVVGAPVEDSNATGVNGNQNGNSATDSGAAYIFLRSALSWTETKLTASTGRPGEGFAGDGFGSSVAIQGNTMVVGAGNLDGTGARKAFVFVRNGTTWTPQGSPLTGAGGKFGTSVAINGDTVVVGALDEGAYAFVRSGTMWVQQAKLTANLGLGSAFFGLSVGVSGNTAVVGARMAIYPINVFSGAVLVFTRSGNNWTNTGSLFPIVPASGDVFGQSVAVGPNAIVSGSPERDVNGVMNAGAAYVFEPGYMCELTADNDAMLEDHFGLHVALSGDTFLAQANSGVYVFVRDPSKPCAASRWSRQTKLNSVVFANEFLGVDQIAVSGDTAVGVGANGEIAVFTRSGTMWTEQAPIRTSDGVPLYRVAIDGDTIVAGGNVPPGTPGAVYVFTRVGLGPQLAISPATSAAPRLAILADGRGGYFLRCYGVHGSTYSLQSAPSVTGPWTTVGPFTVPASGPLEDHVLSLGPGQAFYRTVQP